MISNVEAKWPGSVHDSRIYHESTLSNRVANGNLSFEQITFLCLPLLPHSQCTHYILTGEFHGHLLGDRGYPCQPTLMTPYHDPEPGPQQWYNVAHCRTRARVEMTIGILKARFQCLRRLRVKPERACDIIVACVVLHNIATIRGEQHPAIQNDPEDDHPLQPAHVQDGRAVRDILCPHTLPPTLALK